MAGSVGDIIQVTVRGTWVQQAVVNVYYYRCKDVPTAGYLTGLMTEFQSVVHTAYAGAVRTPLVFNYIQALNIFSGDVLEDNTPTPAAGTVVGNPTPAPPFNAAMVLLVRGNNRVRHGRKFVPLMDDIDINQETIETSCLGRLVTYANVLNDNLFPGGTDEFEPTIVGRIEYVTPQGKTAYRLPATQAEMGDRYSIVTDARVIDRPTTMNSRKIGRGI